MSITDLTDEELAAEAERIETELARRALIADAENRTDETCLTYLQAAGRVQGDAWAAPVGIVGAYPRGWQVTHDGAAYRAAQPGTVTAPPTGWGRVDADPIPYWTPGEYPAGAVVQDKGHTWIARDTVDGPRPSEYPAGWDLTD